MKAKRIFAILGLVIIFSWIVFTVILAVTPFPGKEILFPIFAVGCIFLPILLWIILWMVSFLSGKKNIASFRSKEMEETMKKADKIRYSEEINDKESKDEFVESEDNQ